MITHPESRARLGAALALAVLALWILHGFLKPLAWAVVLALATWPLYRRLGDVVSPRGPPPRWAAAVLTLIVGGMLMGPLTYGVLQLAQDAQSLIQLLRAAQSEGLSPPEWLTQLPRIGGWAEATWADWLGSSEAVRDSIHFLTSAQILAQTKAVAAQILHRSVAAFFTIVALFFVYRDGAKIGDHVLALSDRILGSGGRDYVLHAVAAVRATVNGIVLVALGQGIALGVGYAVAGLQHPTLLAALTAMAAFIPFAAKLIVLSAASVLLVQGHMVAGLGLILYGVVVVLLSDNYVRPALIGGAVQLPFLWTLLGILGGIETFGLLGLFLGPTVMAIMMSVWRDWVAAPPEVHTSAL